MVESISDIRRLDEIQEFFIDHETRQRIDKSELCTFILNDSPILDCMSKLTYAMIEGKNINLIIRCGVSLPQKILEYPYLRNIEWCEERELSNYFRRRVEKCSETYI
jgi:hypothetical protein